jgi:uncharacterized protein (TIGR02147 family)
VKAFGPVTGEQMAFTSVESSLAERTLPPPPVAVLREPVLAEYSDFREYLRDVYDYRRKYEGTGFRPYSYSTFSAAADIKSPNYLKLIIEGRRNLSDDMMARFAKALRLPREEAAEFKALARYGQATEPIERNHYLRELSELRARRELANGNIKSESWDKVPGWIGWVLYAMADQGGVKFNPESLQKLFRPKASTEDIKQSLRKLVESGELLQNPETGEISKPALQSEAAQDLPVALIRKLQAELIYLGIESLFRDSPKDREFGALTMALTQEEFEHVRFELRQLRKRLNKDVSVKREASKGERVYQMNIQLFPVTEKV